MAETGALVYWQDAASTTQLIADDTAKLAKIEELLK